MKKLSAFSITTNQITTGAIIAALYAVLTILLAPISYGPVQFRVSEALCILPIFTPAAVPGLFIGCIISNLFNPAASLIDIIFGSLATLIAALLTRKLRGNVWLATLPPVILNGLIVGFILYYQFALPLFATMGQVALGELGVLYFLGVPLYFLLKNQRAERWIK